MYQAILIHAKGCHHCEELYPNYSQLHLKYPKLTIESIEFTPEIIPYYNSLIPKKTVTETFVDENGVEQKKLKRDEAGKVIYESPLAFPNVIFLQDGKFIGNIVGNNLPAIEHVMTSLSQEGNNE